MVISVAPLVSMLATTSKYHRGNYSKQVGERALQDREEVLNPNP